MSTPLPPRDRSAFQVAIVCTLVLELEYVEALFDISWDQNGVHYGRSPGDENAYSIGKIGIHNVVVVCASATGASSMTKTVASLRSSFTNIKLAFLVGVCGAVPYTSAGKDVFLGDVVISQTFLRRDFDKQDPSEFVMRDPRSHLNDNIGPEFRSFIARAQTYRSQQRLQTNMKISLQNSRPRVEDLMYSDHIFDHLYNSTYIHKHNQASQCRQCSDGTQICRAASTATCLEIGCESKEIARSRWNDKLNLLPDPQVHFGSTVLGDVIMRSAEIRDNIARKHDVIAFDTYGAGYIEGFPFIFVKGVCDYADSHSSGKEWLRYAAATAAACLETLIQRWATEIQAMLDRIVTASTVLWHVPFDDMLGSFSGREEELQIIQKHLSQRSVSQTIAITGLAGIGKSRLALEASCRLREQDPERSVFWVNGSSGLTLKNDFDEIGRRLGVVDTMNENENTDVRKAIKQHLSRRETADWLLVLDNVDDEDILTKATESEGKGISLFDYVPRYANGTILLISRSRQIGVRHAGTRVIPLSELGHKPAIDMLQGLLIRSEVIAEPEASSLLEKLAYIPLAIEQASSYMNMNDLLLHEYLELLNGSEEAIVYLLSEDFVTTLAIECTQSLAAAFSISFNQLRKREPLAARYLCFMSCLSATNIPRFLLPASHSMKSEYQAIGTLAGYGFLSKRDVEPVSEIVYDMHPIVPLLVRNWLKIDNRLHDSIIVTLTELIKKLPTPHSWDKSKWIMLLPHAQALLSFSEALGVELRYELLQRVGICLQFDGRYGEAIDAFSTVATWSEKRFGFDCSSTLLAYNHLAEALRLDGDWERAEAYMVRGLGQDHKTLDLQNPLILGTMTNLANVYHLQGKLDEAESLLSPALTGSMNVLGKEHADTLVRMNNLATIYQSQGRFDQAEDLCTLGLTTAQKALGDGHPLTLSYRSMLAETHLIQGQLSQAETVSSQVLRVSGIVLGTQHPDTIIRLDNLATIYQAQSRWTEAEAICMEVLAASERALGSRHPLTSIRRSKLATIYQNQGRCKEAEQLLSYALADLTKLLGDEHPDTLACLGKLAAAYQEQERWSEAEELFLRALAISERVLGDGHASTLHSIANLASIRWQQGRVEETESLCLRVIQTCENPAVTKQHFVLQCITLRCKVLVSRGAYRDAERLLLSALLAQREILPSDHRDLMESSHVLCSILLEQSVSGIDEVGEFSPGSSYNDVLQYAAGTGQARLVTSLLEKRIDASVFTTVCDRALYSATLGDHEKTVGILLEKGARINYQNEEKLSPLYAASRMGSETLVRFLLERGAEVNMSCGNHGTALHAACATGQVVSVRLLIDHGADLNVQCLKYGSPLLAACAGSHEAAVKLLLSKGADAALGSELHGTPMQMASTNNDQRLLRVLIDWTELHSFFSKTNDTNRSGSETSSVSSVLTSKRSTESLGYSSAPGAPSSVSSTDAEAPEEMYDTLITEVLLHPTMKQLNEQILITTARDNFVENYEEHIRQFCRNLRAESSNQYQRGAIHVIRRHSRYLAHRVTSLLQETIPETPTGSLTSFTKTPKNIAKVEEYLQTLNVNMVWNQTESVEVTGTHKHTGLSHGASVDEDSDESDTGSDDGKDEAHEDEDERNIQAIPYNITKDTVSWLIDSLAFRNLVFDLTRMISSSMTLIEKVLQFALPPSRFSNAVFHLPWTVVEYTRKQLNHVQKLSTVLTLTGEGDHAEASSCRDYCARLWPTDGPAVVKMLQEALENNACDSSLPSGTLLSMQLKADKSISEAAIVVSLKGSKEYIIKIAQQLAWLSTVLRSPKSGFLSYSRYAIYQSDRDACFRFRVLRLKRVKQNPIPCWQPLFRSWVLAQGFPIRPRHGEVGLELPFLAMIQLSEILGPIMYQDGVVLKGLSSILFPVQAPSAPSDTEQASGQWHLIYREDREFANLSLLDQTQDRWHCQLSDLEVLARVRTFLGCYKKVRVHLATSDAAYRSIERPATRPSKPKPELSGFSLGGSFSKILGLNASANFTIPNHALIQKDFGPYEQALAHLSKLPVILYDTLDRRAWMVPALSVILHMVHIWFHIFKDDFPTVVTRPPYVPAVSNIGRATLLVLSQNSTFRLYHDLDDKPYPLKELVTRYCLDIQRLLASPRYHAGMGADSIVGWDIVDVVQAQFGDPKTPTLGRFEGNWETLAQSPNMIVFFGHGLGDVIVPDLTEQTLCRSWTSVPPNRDYLTASVYCLRQCTNYFPGSKDAGKRVQKPCDREITTFADCSHHDHKTCHRGQKLWSRADVSSVIHDLAEEGAIIFGEGNSKLRKRSQGV